MTGELGDANSTRFTGIKKETALSENGFFFYASTSTGSGS